MTELSLAEEGGGSYLDGLHQCSGGCALYYGSAFWVSE